MYGPELEQHAKEYKEVNTTRGLLVPTFGGYKYRCLIAADIVLTRAYLNC